MSLSENLANRTKELQISKELKGQELEDSEFSPIRNKIKELEEQKRQIKMILGSLTLKSDKDIGKGMKEYSTEVKDDKVKESTNIDVILKQNEEVLKNMGVENRDQLAENPEFSEESDIQNYKKAINQEENLKVSDDSLVNKLNSFGINTDSENFNYSFAEKALTEKLGLVNNELLKEKIKTPEGKVEIIDIMVNDMEKTLVGTQFTKDEKTKNDKLLITNGYTNTYLENQGIKLVGGKATFENINNINLLPPNIKDLELVFGSELAKEAIKKSYKNKISKNFDDFDKRNENSYALKEQLKQVSPIEGSKAQEALVDYKRLQNEFRNTIKEKSEELKNLGIDFNPSYPSGYGGSYEDLISFGSKQDVEDITQKLNDVSIFPPKFDYNKLHIAINKQKQNLQEFIDTIKNIKTQEDVSSFLEGTGRNSHNSQVSKFHLANMTDTVHSYDYNSKFKVEDPNGYNNKGADVNPVQILISQAKTFNEAERILNEKIAKLENSKEMILNKIDLAIDTRFKRKELDKEIDMQNLKINSNVDNEILNIEKDRNEALDLISQLVKLESELPQEEIFLTGNKITVPSVVIELEKLSQNKGFEEQKLKDLNQKISNHDLNKPKWFGKDKWEEESVEYKKEQDEIKNKIQKMGNEEYSALYKKAYINIPFNQNSEIGKIFINQNFNKGNPNEVIKRLKDKLLEAVDRKIPTSVINLNEEYKELEKKLNQ
jgi:hypothetical protein